MSRLRGARPVTLGSGSRWTAWASPRLAAALAASALAMEAIALLLLVPNSAAAGLEEFGFNGVGGVVLGATYPVIGWILASRRPRNPIGWIFLIVGVSQAGTAMVGQYAAYGLVTSPGALPLADLASWFGVWTWVPGFVLLFVMVLVFPDGALPSPRWRPVLWTAGLAAGLTAIPTAIAAWGIRGPALLTDPVPTEGDPLVQAAIAMATVGTFLVIPVGLAAVAGILVRFRRSGAVERQQIKWFAAAAVVEVGLLVVTGTELVVLRYPLDILAGIVVVPLVPIATAIAVLRYRLYEIDRVISRTLGWAIVTGILIAVFAGSVVVLETLLAPLVKESTLAVAASTLIAFALFQPLRRRVQRGVDRRFDRARYDGQRLADTFATAVRNEVDLGVLGASLAATAHSAVRPEGVTVWLRPKATGR